jgi:sec-independent protein translocase protein TatB
MLFDLGWSEILLIGTVALVFIGPKDLPKALRVAGYWVRKARTLSREFQNGIDQMIREAELDDMRQQLKKATEFDLDKEFRNTIDPTGSLAETLAPPALPDFSAAAAGTAPSTADAAPATEVAAVAGTALPETGGVVAKTVSETAEAAAVRVPPPSGEPVPVVAAPESELDEIAPAPTSLPLPAGGPGFVPPKP